MFSADGGREFSQEDARSGRAKLKISGCAAARTHPAKGNACPAGAQIASRAFHNRHYRLPSRGPQSCATWLISFELIFEQ
jgi:hypothetical protein